MLKSPRSMLFACVLSASLLAGCGGEDLGGPEATAVSYGRTPNGRTPNGRTPNGTLVGGVYFSGVTIGGSALASVSISGSQLIGYRWGFLRKIWYTGYGFIGAIFPGVTDQGVPVTLRIVNVSQIPDPTPAAVNQGTLWAYTVSVLTPQGVWEPACGVDEAQNPIQAFALNGRWNYQQGVPGGGAKIADPSAFTFGCRFVGAIGKCVELGYKPWMSIPGTESLDPHHQACVRMLRADYCGDGTSYTVNGTIIDAFDWVGVQVPATEWSLEGEWNAAGATCLSQEGVDNILETFAEYGSAYAPRGLPPCLGTLVSSSCGNMAAGFFRGTKTLDRFEPGSDPLSQSGG